MQPSCITEYRNVVVVGKSGAGKSTVANKIIGSTVFRVADSLGSVTKRQTHAQVGMHFGNVEYRMKVVDAVGLFDTGKDKSDNQAIMDEIKHYFTEKFPEGINLVLFIFKKGRFTQEERETFDFIIREFREAVSEMSALIITNCENMGKKAREEYIMDFRSRPATADIANFMGKGIYAVGFPDLSHMEEDDEDMMLVLSKKAEKDVQQLRELVFGSREMTLGKDMFERIMAKIQRQVIMHQYVAPTSSNSESQNDGFCGIL
jgi:GTP-binding protein EngB required for normal cell division